MTSQRKSFRSEIEDTEIFKSLGPVLKKITLTRNVTKLIEHGVVMVENIGYKKWEKQSDYNWRNKEIVKQIVKSREYVRAE